MYILCLSYPIISLKKHPILTISVSLSHFPSPLNPHSSQMCPFTFIPIFLRPLVLHCLSALLFYSVSRFSSSVNSFFVYSFFSWFFLHFPNENNSKRFTRTTTIIFFFFVWYFSSQVLQYWCLKPYYLY